MPKRPEGATTLKDIYDRAEQPMAAPIRQQLEALSTKLARRRLREARERGEISDSDYQTLVSRL